jgi:hypothetical protein
MISQARAGYKAKYRGSPTREKSRPQHRQQRRAKSAYHHQLFLFHRRKAFNDAISSLDDCEIERGSKEKYLMVSSLMEADREK